MITRQRPALHFTARRGWINDPLGVTYRGGQYHVFFQHVPGRTTWTPSCHWGHATSADLLRWTELPDALAPADDEDGCWSGCVVKPADGAEPVLFYTSVAPPDHQAGRVRRARPVDDGWIRWRADGYVIAELPASNNLRRMRDPFVFRDGADWRMLVGAGFTDGTAAALTYVSADLQSWRYDGVLTQRSTYDTDSVWTGTLWECPQLFRLGNQDVLLVSVWDADVLHYVAYGIGRYRAGRFQADTWRRLTYGPCHYAATSFRDVDNRVGMLTWLRGVDDPYGTWAGALSLPMVLAADDGQLVATPHPNVERMRKTEVRPGERALSTTADIEWTPRATDAQLRVHDQAGTVLGIQRIGSDVTVSRPGDSAGTRWSMPDQEGIVRIVVAAGVAEVFARSGILAVPTKGLVPPLTTVGEPGTVQMWALS